MNLYDGVLSILTSRYVPPSLLRGVVRRAVRILRQRLEAEDQRQLTEASAVPPPEWPLFLVDGYHGGVVFWDWLVLPGGGLWYLYCWPLCVSPALERAARDLAGSKPLGLKVVFDFDAYTYEEMARKAPEATERMRQAIGAGQLEIVNGTYGQPLAYSTSGEAFVRHLQYGLASIREALGTDVKVFYSQEPAYMPQLPQLLRGFGYSAVVFRTQWAAFGTDPACDAALVRWQGPDGSVIPAVPRYTFQHYERQRADHPGLANMSLGAGELADWEPESLAPFAQASLEHGIDQPLVSDLKDTNLPDAPWSRAIEVASLDNVDFVTLAEYLELVPEEGPLVSYALDDIPSTLPWGLQAERLLRARAGAEAALLTAERLDAVAFVQGRASDGDKLHGAWKSLCLAQHHDLQVCAPWHSRQHDQSMGEVGQDLALAAWQGAGQVGREALDYLLKGLGSGLALFNPSPWSRREYVEVNVGQHEEAGPATEAQANLTPNQGAAAGLGSVPCQVVSQAGESLTLGFVSELPGMGTVALDVSGARPVLSQPEEEEEETASRFRFENVWYSAEVSDDGCLAVEVGGQPAITAGGYFTVWRNGAWHDSRHTVQAVECIAEGPVFTRCKVEGEVAGVPFRLVTTFYRGLARIDSRVTFDFGQKGVYLGPQIADDRPERAMSIQDEKKLCVAFASPPGVICCDSAFQVSETARENIVGLRWVGLEGEDGAGFAVLNRGTQGYHFDREAGVLRNVLAWGPKKWIYASNNSISRGRSRYTALRGQETFEYAILPYTSRPEAQRAAFDYNLPWLSQSVSGDAAEEARSASFLSVRPAEAMITALFVRGDKVYARLWNCSNRETLATLRAEDELQLIAVDLGLKEQRALAGGSVRLPSWGVQTVELRRLPATSLEDPVQQTE